MTRSLLVLCGLMLAVTASGTPGRPHKVAVCHIPPGNPANMHTIVVDVAAVPAHLNHGDFLGFCEAAPPPEPEPEPILY